MHTEAYALQPVSHDVNTLHNHGTIIETKKITLIQYH